jgi:hypothetical protein
MQRADLTFWVFGSDAGWSVRFPVCDCVVTSTAPVRTPKEGNSMGTEFVASPISKAWRELYKAALFETDKSKLSERIAHAEWSLVLRARELFHTVGDHLEERQAIDAAIYALHALRRATRLDGGRKEPKRQDHDGAHAA